MKMKPMTSRPMLIVRLMADTGKGRTLLRMIDRPATLPSGMSAGCRKKYTEPATMAVPSVMIRNSSTLFLRIIPSERNILLSWYHEGRQKATAARVFNFRARFLCSLHKDVREQLRGPRQLCIIVTSKRDRRRAPRPKPECGTLYLTAKCLMGLRVHLPGGRPPV